jgi:hypothetical protein
VALTRPGKLLVGLVTVVVLVGGGLFAYSALTGNAVFGVDPPGGNDGEPGDLPVPDACPLTGLQAEVPNRPVLAVKIENAQASRPQSGLDNADIVYEQPTEGAITRFIAIFQCQDAERLGPVRSTRLADPDIVSQFGPSTPLFAHSGGIPEIVDGITRAGITDVGFDRQPSVYERDINRPSPHNLYTSTSGLYDAADDPTGVPAPMFTYDPRVPQGARPATTLTVGSSSQFSDETILWRYDTGKKAYVRFHGDTAHTVEGGAQVQARNVIIQYVQTRPSGFTDVNGVPVLEVASVGEGDAIVLRNGQAIEGRWVRSFPEDVTKFLDGERQIDLQAGNTWIMLVPVGVAASFE